MEQRDLIIIGAGQAGLATAFAARELGLDAVVLEASQQAAGSWPTYYDSLRLFSPARYSSLPGRTFPGSDTRAGSSRTSAWASAFGTWSCARARGSPSKPRPG